MEGQGSNKKKRKKMTETRKLDLIKNTMVAWKEGGLSDKAVCKIIHDILFTKSIAEEEKIQGRKNDKT